MNNKVNYTLVGSFVLIGFFIVSLVAYWMLRPSHDYEIKRYVVYFDESVFGLNIDAPVKFRGIRVGAVSNLRINPENDQQVEVQVTIQKDTPITQSTVAVLTAQGITGLTYINLTNGSGCCQKEVEINGKLYTEIKSAPSLFKNMEKSLGTMYEDITQTLHQTSELINMENQKKFFALIDSTTLLLDKLSQTMDEKTIGHFQHGMANLDNAIYKVDYLVENTITWENNVSNILYGVWLSYKDIQASAKKVTDLVDAGQFNIKDISGEVLPNINNTLFQVQESMVRIENSLLKLEQNPSDVIFKRQEIKKGPGEE